MHVEFIDDRLFVRSNGPQCAAVFFFHQAETHGGNVELRPSGKIEMIMQAVSAEKGKIVCIQDDPKHYPDRKLILVGLGDLAELTVEDAEELGQRIFAEVGQRTPVAFMGPEEESGISGAFAAHLAKGMKLASRDASGAPARLMFFMDTFGGDVFAETQYAERLWRTELAPQCENTRLTDEFFRRHPIIGRFSVLRWAATPFIPVARPEVAELEMD